MGLAENEGECSFRMRRSHIHGIDASYEKVLPEEEAKGFRRLYDPERTSCLCGQLLTFEPIIYYVPHPDGWTVNAEEEKAWLYVKCPKCGYDMAVWKMGVPREVMETQP